ncbi:MAG: alpha-L-arabinofuranosidase [Chitinophagaceae bacterium]|nr:alpha-L-arabinofuranosidase [Chitinophagaceae bacterium]
MKSRQFLLTGLATGVLAFFSLAQTKNTIISIQAGKPYAEVQPAMWGVFFEDINLGADGGIYAELVKNRSFEFLKPLMGWKVEQKPFVEGAVTILSRPDNTSNPRFARIKVNNAVSGNLSMTNEGFRGMGVKKGLRYDFSVMYRQSSAGVKMHIELLSAKDAVIGTAVLTPAATGNSWKKEAVSFHSAETEPKAKLRIWFEGTGVIDLDMISLFPEDTWKKRPGGMRADMIQLLADMKPGFIRFPGGCIVEGMDLSNRYQWKKTIGPVEERQLMINRWNIEFAHRPTPDYFQTFGLGFFEYFQLAEDIGAEPLPILNCGMACQFNTAELVPLDQLDPYVQDALDLIEFANGDVSTKWGKVRAGMGHPVPFNLKMLGVGNENWGPQYIERLAIFQKAIQAKYPAIKLVTSSGTDPNGERFDHLNSELRKMKADIIDEHFYRKPEWFFENVSRYDNYDRNGPKIFAGEYAGQSVRTASGENKNNVRTAIAEAAFLTGLERNADVVVMASYAPLFAHVDGWQWTPDLIWVDNLRSAGTVNYHVQKLYATNKGTHAIPALLNNKAVTGQDSLYASAVFDKGTNEVIIKIVNASFAEKTTGFSIEGVKKLLPQGTITVLTGQPDEVNSLDTPFAVSPVVTTVPVKGKKIDVALKPFSFTVIKLVMK